MSTTRAWVEPCNVINYFHHFHGIIVKDSNIWYFILSQIQSLQTDGSSQVKLHSCFCKTYGFKVMHLKKIAALAEFLVLKIRPPCGTAIIYLSQ